MKGGDKLTPFINHPSRHADPSKKRRLDLSGLVYAAIFGANSGAAGIGVVALLLRLFGRRDVSFRDAFGRMGLSLLAYFLWTAPEEQYTPLSMISVGPLTWALGANRGYLTHLSWLTSLAGGVLLIRRLLSVQPNHNGWTATDYHEMN